MTVSENSGSQMVSGEEAARGRVLFLTSVDRRGRLILFKVTRALHKLTSEKKKKGAELLFSNCTVVGVDVHPTSNRWITHMYYLPG